MIFSAIKSSPSTITLPQPNVPVPITLEAFKKPQRHHHTWQKPRQSSRKRAIHYLVMFNFSSGIVPGKNSELRSETSQGDEVLGLGNINGLLVNTRWQSNDSSTGVAEWNRVYGFLCCSVVSTAVLGHCYHPCRHWSNKKQPFSSLSLSVCLKYCPSLCVWVKWVTESSQEARNGQTRKG